MLWKPGESKSVGPAGKAAEQMHAPVALHVSCPQVGNASLIDDALGNQSRLNQFSRPGTRARIVVAV